MVFCGHCKSYRSTTYVGMGGTIPAACKNVKNIKFVVTPSCQYKQYIQEPRELNADNDCQWYKPSLWTRLFRLDRKTINIVSPEEEK